MLPFLQVLKLRMCDLQNTSRFVSPSNLTRLEIIDMSFNSIEKQFDTITWVWDAAGLKYLNLESNGVYGVFPAKLGQLSSLEVLMLSWNNMKGIIPDTLCSLRVLELAKSHVQGDVMEFIKTLPECSWSKLQVLRLGRNNLTGSLSDQISHLTSITTLDLRFNKLTGTLPTVIGKLHKLIYLHLGYNQIHGLVTEDHFSSLTELRKLHLSGNLFSMELKTNWIPPFSLDSLGLTSCRLGPRFPQ
ncbi:LRR receptor-like serine/threonine-protein kinase GSO1 [Hordeum vulgare]|nr:LRR receptor-like serine/threonine-protein kinase GSO1 [Hordeum vulgare]